MLTALWNAWKAGQELADPAKWKNRQLTSNLIGIIIIAVIQIVKLKFPAFDLSADVIDLISLGVSAFLAAGNVYLTKATTKKI